MQTVEVKERTWQLLLEETLWIKKAAKTRDLDIGTRDYTWRAKNIENLHRPLLWLARF